MEPDETIVALRKRIKAQEDPAAIADFGRERESVMTTREKLQAHLETCDGCDIPLTSLLANEPPTCPECGLQLEVAPSLGAVEDYALVCNNVFCGLNGVEQQPDGEVGWQG